MSPSPLTLATFEVSVGGRRGALAWTKFVAVDRDAHRATRREPFSSGIFKDLMQPFGLGGSLDRQLRRRHGRRQAFLCEAGLGPDVHLLCVGPVPRDGADS